MYFHPKSKSKFYLHKSNTTESIHRFVYSHEKPKNVNLKFVVLFFILRDLSPFEYLCITILSDFGSKNVYRVDEQRPEQK